MSIRDILFAGQQVLKNLFLWLRLIWLVVDKGYQGEEVSPGMIDNGATEHQHILGKRPQGINGIECLRIRVLNVVALVEKKVCKLKVTPPH